MSENEYVITINQRIVDDTAESVPSSTPVSAETTAKKTVVESRGKNIGAIAAIGLGKQALNYGLSNYGNLTGDYITQKKLKAGVSIAASAAMIAANPVVGGIAVGGTVAFQATTAIIDVVKANNDVMRLRARTQTMVTSGGRR